MLFTSAIVGIRNLREGQVTTRELAIYLTHDPLSQNESSNTLLIAGIDDKYMKQAQYDMILTGMV